MEYTLLDENIPAGEERGCAVGGKCGQIFCTGFEHEIVYDGVGVGEAEPGLPVSNHARSDSRANRKWKAGRAALSGGAGRSEPFEPQVPVYVERGIRRPIGKSDRRNGGCGGGGKE